MYGYKERYKRWFITSSLQLRHDANLDVNQRKTLQVHLVYGDVNHLLPLSGSYHIKEYTLSTYKTKLTCRKVMPMASSPAKKETLLILNNQNGKTRLPDCYKIVGKV
jgi:hypothetical protein